MIRNGVCELCDSVSACVDVMDIGFVCARCIGIHAKAFREPRYDAQPQIVASTDSAVWWSNPDCENRVGAVMFVEFSDDADRRRMERGE